MLAHASVFWSHLLVVIFMGSQGRRQSSPPLPMSGVIDSLGRMPRSAARCHTCQLPIIPLRRYCRGGGETRKLNPLQLFFSVVVCSFLLRRVQINFRVRFNCRCSLKVVSVVACLFWFTAVYNNTLISLLHMRKQHLTRVYSYYPVVT